ncbi:MAG: hypothetical protein PHO20_01550 [Candidatus Peribacteraceae bacterium]|jgi:hypothetical protein|nr:hypothetical protein [Candidatus Peribacteraceae bacterium]MDD5739433.1 hypothetical protein [Candidatus Peribacteraceae bacterium]
MDVLFPILGWCALILCLEGILWVLFSRRFTQICLPSGDHTIFHIFTIWRLRVIILLHTVFLLASVIVSHLLLWP